jgi:hypothetical protein
MGGKRGPGNSLQREMSQAQMRGIIQPPALKGDIVGNEGAMAARGLAADGGVWWLRAWISMIEPHKRD